MRLEGVAIIPTCEECEVAWLPADDEPWSAYLADNEPPRSTARSALHGSLAPRLTARRALRKSNVKSLDTRRGMARLATFGRESGRHPLPLGAPEPRGRSRGLLE
jgi:hypothetical protein